MSVIQNRVAIITDGPSIKQLHRLSSGLTEEVCFAASDGPFYLKGIPVINLSGNNEVSIKGCVTRSGWKEARKVRIYFNTRTRRGELFGEFEINDESEPEGW